MKTVKISLNSIDKVKSFVNDITKFEALKVNIHPAQNNKHLHTS